MDPGGLMGLTDACSSGNHFHIHREGDVATASFLEKKQPNLMVVCLRIMYLNMYKRWIDQIIAEG